MSTLPADVYKAIIDSITQQAKVRLDMIHASSLQRKIVEDMLDDMARNATMAVLNAIDETEVEVACPLCGKEVIAQ